MTVIQALLLGIVQGLTEFLPVSSSGHLVLLQNLFNIDLCGADMFFDVVLHIGSLFAVCTEFYRDIFNLFRKPRHNLFYLISATIPAAIAGVFLNDIVDKVFFGGKYLFVCFAFTGIILAAARIYSVRKKDCLPLCKKSVAAMGVAQAVAIIPGISRSGATVAAGMLAGCEREQAARFSFLMSIPVICGSFIVTFIKGIADGEIISAFVNSGQNFSLCVVISMASAAVAGMIAIKIMLNATKKATYTPFIIYLIILSAFCCYLTFTGRL